MKLTHRQSDDAPEIAVTISTSTFFKLAGLVVATIIALMALHRAAHALLLVGTAFFLAVALNAPVHRIAQLLPGKLHGNRTFGTALSFLLVVVVLGLFIASLTPPLVRQTESFISAAPGLVSSLRSQDSETGKIIRKYHLESQVSKLSTQLSERLQNVSGSAFSTVSSIGSSIFSVLTILALTFMMLIEGPRRLKFIQSLLPNRRQGTADRLAKEMYRVVKGYVNGQVVLAAIASALIFPALLVLGISYPVALVFVVFICGLIPMVGHTLGAIIVTAVALFHSPTTAITILIYYILYQQIENYVIQPRIQANSTDMSPLLVFMAVVIGVSFSGLFGGLVAIPLAGCMRILALEYLRTHHIISPAKAEAEIKADTK